MSNTWKFSIETDDECFIISEAYFNRTTNSVEVKLLKLSAEGELLRETCVGKEIGLVGLFHDPEQEGQYVLILFKFGIDDLTTPCVLRFDDNLNILSEVDVEIPSNLPNTNISQARAIIGNDNKVYLSYIVMPPVRRYHLRFTLDGQVEASLDDGSSLFLGSLLLYPDGSCCSYSYGGLCRFDDSLNLNLIQSFFKIVDEKQGNDISHQVWLKQALYPTAVALCDSTVLIAEEAMEYWQDPYGFIVDRNYEQMVFFKVNPNRVVEKVLIEGTRDTLEMPTYYQSIDYVYSDAIYLSGFQYREPVSGGNLVLPNKIFLKKVDRDLTVIWEKSYILGTEHYMPSHMIATHDGGCLITGKVIQDNYQEEEGLFILKINGDGSVGTDEVQVENLRPYAYYPIPAQDQLRLQFSPDVTPTRIELYDLQGRLVRSQRNDLESINLEGLASGTYTMRVIMEDGKVFADKVVKE